MPCRKPPFLRGFSSVLAPTGPELWASHHVHPAYSYFPTLDERQKNWCDLFANAPILCSILHGKGNKLFVEYWGDDIETKIDLANPLQKIVYWLSQADNYAKEWRPSDYLFRSLFKKQ